MAQRIEVGPRPEVDDPRGNLTARHIRDFLGLAAKSVRTRAVYKLSFDLPTAELESIRQALTDPVLEESASGRLPTPRVDWVIAVGFLPGVTDNVGRTAGRFIADVLGHAIPSGSQIATETLYFVVGPGLSRLDVDRIGAELLANPLIESIRIWSAASYEEVPIDLDFPLAGDSTTPRAIPVLLPEDPRRLMELSRGRTLSLGLEELLAIRRHFSDEKVRARRGALGLPVDPTDLELETLAQTWSEHCKHKIFNARIKYTDEDGRSELIDSLFRTCIVDVTDEIARRVDWLVSVFEDNAGVVALNDDLHLVYKVETHNSPSALDPYGGAMTGIVGVNRDPLGTGIGAALLTNVWGYCLASPFFTGEIPAGLHHPRRIRDGVHRGVIDGGNQSGIPYARGFELFDERYLGKPLVFCGTVGIMPARIHGRPSQRKEVRPGDHVVMVGGRIGKDGIHGATFSSEALHSESPAQAVQIGDPITQKMMSEMLIEARDRGLYRTLTDNGAGGLSSSVGELARLCGGAELDLALPPLKYSGLQSWEILLSEAQERMTLAVPDESLAELLELARQREVEATSIGRFTDSGTFRLRYRDEVVGDLDMAFLHDGCPTLELEAEWIPPRASDPDDLDITLDGLDASLILDDLLARLNLCSKEMKCRQYDHEVKGLSVIKPLIGARGDMPADATVMRVAHGQPEAILLAEGIAPRLSDLDAGAMAAYVVDLAVRRIVAGGGRLGRIAGLDNFCWPDPVQSENTPDGKQKLAALVRACRSLAEMTRGLDLPCISGKDSMKNDSFRGGVKISIPPTLLFSALSWIEDASRAMDLVPGGADEIVYVIGETRAELGASELFALLADRFAKPELIGKRPPKVSPTSCRSVCASLEEAIGENLVSAAHAPHLGGIGIGLAWLCLASELGIEASLDEVPGARSLSPMETLFSESGSRFLVCIRPEHRAAFEALLARHAVLWASLGRVTEKPELIVSHRDKRVVRRTVSELRSRFAETLHGF